MQVITLTIVLLHLLQVVTEKDIEIFKNDQTTSFSARKQDKTSTELKLKLGY